MSKNIKKPSKNTLAKRAKLDENLLPQLNEFTDEELQQLYHYGKALHVGTTSFDDEVERELEKLEAEKQLRGTQGV